MSVLAFANSPCVSTGRLSASRKSFTCGRSVRRYAMAGSTRSEVKEEVREEEDGQVTRCEWVEHCASIPIEASADELFVYYSDLENLPKWYVIIIFYFYNTLLLWSYSFLQSCSIATV